MSVQESLDPVWRPDTPAVREAEAALEAARDARSRAWADDNDKPAVALVEASAAPSAKDAAIEKPSNARTLTVITSLSDLRERSGQMLPDVRLLGEAAISANAS